MFLRGRTGRLWPGPALALGVVPALAAALARADCGTGRVLCRVMPLAQVVRLSDYLVWPVFALLSVALIAIVSSILVRREVRLRTQELRESEERYRRLVQQANCLILQLDGEGQVQFANEVALQALGFAPGGLAGQAAQGTFAPAGADGLSPLAAMARRVLAEGAEPTGLECECVRRDGTALWVLWNVSCARDAHGKAVGLTCVGQDVTERRRAEETLRAEQAERTVILESLSELLVYHDGSMRVLWANKAAGDSVGARPEDLIGRYCYEIWHGRGAACDDCPVAEALRTGAPQEGEIVTPDGRVWVIRGYPVRDARSEIIGVVESTLDVSARKTAEDALRESEAQYRSTLESMVDAIHVVDRNLRITLMNRAFREWNAGLGLETDVIGRHLREVFPFLTDEVAEQYERVFSSGEPMVTEEATRLAGRKLYTETRKVPMVVGDRTVSVVTVVRDITERKRAEDALRASEANYRALFDTSADAILVYDPERGVVLDANRTAAELYGYSRQEILRLRPEELSGQDVGPHRAQLDASVRRVIAGEPFTLEWQARHKSGRVFWIEVTLKHAIIGGQSRILAFMRDITERRQAQNAVRESSEKFQSIVDNVNLGIALIGADMKIIEMNRRMRDWLPGAEGTPWPHCYEVLGSGDGQEPCPDCCIRQAIQTGKTHERTFRSQRDSEEATLRMICSPVHDAAGAVVAATVILEDITQREATEEQLRRAVRMESLGRLAGGVAHDFNNLLTGIIGYTELLADEVTEGSDTAADLHQIRDLAYRGAELTQQLLAFSRRHPVQLQALDLNSVVANCASMLQRLIGEDVLLEFNPGPALHTVHADRGQVEQILMNLAVNARDAMPRGGKLTISSANLDLSEGFGDGGVRVQPGRYVLVSIADTGTGMDEAVQRHIFEPFFTTKEVGKGTGLGLATVYGIIRQHRGQIAVTSKLGRGTTFRIYLPAAEAAPAAAEPRPARQSAPSGTETILVVEDEESVRELVARVLERQGYRVFAAEHPAAAELIFAEHGSEIDLLLTDAVMPGRSGPELYEVLHAKDPDLAVVFMSGYTESEIMVYGLDSHETRFLMKPFQPDVLAATVRRILDRARDAREQS